MTIMSLSKTFSRITEDEILLTGEDVAKLLNIIRTKGFDMIRFGQIPSISLGRCVRVCETMPAWTPDQFETVKKCIQKQFGIKSL